MIIILNCSVAHFSSANDQDCRRKNYEDHKLSAGQYGNTSMFVDKLPHLLQWH